MGFLILLYLWVSNLYRVRPGYLSDKKVFNESLISEKVIENHVNNM